MSTNVNKFQNCQICQKLSNLSKVVIQSCHKKLSSKIVIKNCHKKLSSKSVIKKFSSKIVIKNCHQKMSSKYVIKKCHQKCSSKIVGQVMSPHHSDQMSQWSQVSSIALCMAKVKSVSDSVSE